MITLTFNQWIMAGFIVAVSLLLLGWIFLCIFNKKFQERWLTTGEDSVPMTREQYHDNVTREMYAIWVGRFSDIAHNDYSILQSGEGESKAIRWEHFLTLVIWVLTIIGVIGFLSGYYHRDFWLFFLGLIVLGTYWYARWKASTVLPERGD